MLTAAGGNFSVTASVYRLQNVGYFEPEKELHLPEFTTISLLSITLLLERTLFVSVALLVVLGVERAQNDVWIASRPEVHVEG